MFPNFQISLVLATQLSVQNMQFSSTEWVLFLVEITNKM